MTTSAKPNNLSDVMTPNPVCLPATATLGEAAAQMKSVDVGDVIVMTDGSICGVVTDRDIVIRAIAGGRDPQQTKLGDICSRNLVTVDRNASIDDAVALMREHAVRRLPVTAGGTPVGVVSIGDLAMMRDPDSALADISAAPANG